MFTNDVTVGVYKGVYPNYYEYIDTIKHHDTEYIFELGTYENLDLLILSTDKKRAGKFSIEGVSIVDHRLSPGAIVAIVLGSIAAVICIGLTLCCCVKLVKRIKQKRQAKLKIEQERLKTLHDYHAIQQPSISTNTSDMVSHPSAPVYSNKKVMYPYSNFPKSLVTSE